MDTTKLQSETSFLTNLAISQFNMQYGRAIDPKLCTIWSIEPDYGAAYGYEIRTSELTDYVKLRIYLSLGHLDKLENFRVETTKEFIYSHLGDEVFVSTGVVNSWYVDSLTYRFRWIDAPEGSLPGPLELMNGDQFEFMNGQVFETLS